MGQYVAWPACVGPYCKDRHAECELHVLHGVPVGDVSIGREGSGTEYGGLSFCSYKCMSEYAASRVGDDHAHLASFEGMEVPS